MSEYSSASQIDSRKIRPFIFIGVAILLLIIFWNKVTIKIPAGHAGLLYEYFSGGIDTDQIPMGQGFHVIAPWNSVVVYEIRQDKIEESMQVRSSNLLDIDLDITVFFEPILNQLGYLEVERGRGYKERVLVPALRSITREVVARYTPEEINNTKREQIRDEIFRISREKLQTHYVQVNDILIRKVNLPPKLKAAIERKLQQEQESLEYEFRLEKETKEAERKRIEAEGIQNFQKIVSQSITKDLLKWKGIEATEALSKSENAKVIVVGSGKDGLPIILGGN